MSSTYSPILRTELIGNGDQAGAWGATTNSNFQYIFESAIAGYQLVTVSSTNQVLTYTNGPSSTGSLDQSIYAILKFTGTSTASNIFAPPVSKAYVLWNATTATLTLYNSTVIGNTTIAGVGIAIPAGARVTVWSDGTNFYQDNYVVGNLTVTGALTAGSISLTSPLPVASGGTGLSSVTNHYVPYGNGTSPLQTSPQFQYNGSYLLVGSSAALGGATNPVVAMTGTANGYIQSYIYNSQNNTSSSADFVAYPSNGADSAGWIDMGITSLAFNDVLYTVTGPNESYLFASAPSGSGTSGNLVYATDSTGTQNYHQWYVGGFNAAKSAWKMQLTTAGLQVLNSVAANSFIGAGTGLTGTASSLSIGGNAATATSATTVTTTIASGATGTTQTAGDNSTKIATTAYVATAVSGGIGGLGTMATQNANAVAITGGTISGLSSLGVSGTATATTFSGAGTSLTGTAAGLSIGGNAATATSATTVTTTISSGATGTTQTAGDNSTKIATTAYVNNAVSTATGGLGTMSTQNANAVAITGGTMSGMTSIAGGTVGGTTITASTQFSGPGTGLTGTASSLSIGGNAAGLSATLAVASGGTGVTSSTGSGAVVLSTSPTLVTPALGTPSSGNLANCTFPTLNQNTTGTAGGLTGTPNITVGTVSGTTITASTQFSGPGTGLSGTASGLSIGGNAATATNAAGLTGTPNITVGTVSGTTITASTQFTGPGTGLTGTAASLSIGGNAANVTGTVAVANGGTGITSAGTSGNVLTSNGTSWASTALPAAPQLRTLTFASSGSWTAPAGVTKIFAAVVGGGGGGAASFGALGGPNGGVGGIAIGEATTVPGTTYTITVGAGGTGSNFGNGTAGGTSSIGAVMSATGGGGGTGYDGANGNGTGGTVKNNAIPNFGTVAPVSILYFTGVAQRNYGDGVTAGLAWSITSDYLPGSHGTGEESSGANNSSGGVGGAVIIQYVGA